MTIKYINNEGGGFAGAIEVVPATTVKQLFEQKQPGQRPEDHLIRVNRQIATADQVLQEGDRVSITPIKIAGAAAA